MVVEQSSDIGKLPARKRGRGIRLSKDEREVAQVRFLEVYAQTANISLSCKAAGVSRETYRYWKQKDNGRFLDRLAVADKEADEALEAELHRRAVVGVEEPVYYKGKIVGHIRKLSDNLLMFRIKRRMPEYRDSPQAVAQAKINLYKLGDGPAKRIEDMTEEELEVAIPQLEEKIGDG